MTSTKLEADGSGHSVLTGPWRSLVTPALSGAANMAMDYALMERARRTGERVFRVYTWSSPTLSLGRHQAARGRIDAGATRQLGVSLVRRPTGGRALLHHREVTYSVTASLGREESARDWYESINEVLLAALQALGVNAQPAVVSGRTPLPGSGSCFVRADEGEISVDGLKLVGSALLRQDGALLQHGSILLDDDQHLLEQLLPAGEAPPTPAGTLRRALGRTPAVGDVTQALFTSLQRVGDVELQALARDERLRSDASEAEQLYASEEWTFRH